MTARALPLNLWDLIDEPTRQDLKRMVSVLLLSTPVGIFGGMVFFLYAIVAGRKLSRPESIASVLLSTSTGLMAYVLARHVLYFPVELAAVIGVTIGSMGSEGYVLVVAFAKEKLGGKQ